MLDDKDIFVEPNPCGWILHEVHWEQATGEVIASLDVGVDLFLPDWVWGAFNA